MMPFEETAELPAANVAEEKMPGHWLLARLGKRVLRPGGVELTRKMLTGLAVAPTDDVVEYAPGLGATTKLVLDANPASYVGIERDKDAARLVQQVLRDARDEVKRGSAANTGLPDACATVVFAEAMLTMQSDKEKRAIVREAYRILRPGGRYGIHELGLTPDDLADDQKRAIQQALSDSIHIGARPLTSAEWASLLEEEGFEIVFRATAPMALLQPSRMIADEGLRGFLRFVGNVARNPAARKRVLTMRGVFKKYATALNAVTFVARKK